ncbi:ring-1,2-phenylacetyl-CoA epoxidase subunit PaaD [Actinokineospora iranica]|uniref:Ring-1,2-phenylacetyl-CoA epoxidase subunit PaaD n=1 Tax=Actinokineospora iranica TaxID=1271860 RepID=A0A1G6USD6_9PSEU|nr:ring-1,2-phenylacetyl-CoA epoxidase subunit PaaD [Actinokineospora iranica]
MSARRIAEQVLDPELPVLTLADLGILREVSEDGGKVTVTITPTYSGCPALDEMRADLRARLAAAGYTEVEVRTVLHPAWTTDWISAEGLRKLAEHAIAPPHRVGPVRLNLEPPPARRVPCPRCGSPRTTELSRFGSTACKALRRCEDCREPFEQLKEH